MTLTEVALELADERVALCRHTMAPRACHGVYRILDQGRLSGRFVALVTLVGAREAALDLARDLQRERSTVDVDVVAQDGASTTFRTAVPLDAQDASQARLHAALRLFERLSPETLIEPMLFRGGRVRARLIVPRHVDTGQVHAVLADAQQAAGFRELRLLRVARVDADKHLDVLRPLLTPDQDDLLRLAVSMGYYANPKRATLEDISTRVGLSISPIHKRLKAAEELLVCTHVGGGARAPMPPARRRSRRRGGLAHPGGACELDVLGRAPSHPITRALRLHRGARMLLQPISEDARAGLASWTALAVASASQTESIASALQAEPGVRVETVAREDGHACFRLHGPSHGGWSSQAFSAAFGGPAALRRVVFDGDDVYARVLLTTPEPIEDLEARLGKVLSSLGWQEHDVLCVTPADGARVPTDLPEPLSMRQEEVLKVAHALGYYRTPRGCTLEQVASTLGVSANAIHKNLVGAEARIIAHYLAAGI